MAPRTSDMDINLSQNTEYEWVCMDRDCDYRFLPALGFGNSSGTDSMARLVSAALWGSPRRDMC